MARVESEVADFERAAYGSLSPGAGFADPKAHLLSLTELVQQTSVVLGEIFAEIEASRTTRY
jgi:hypothetical protein